MNKKVIFKDNEFYNTETYKSKNEWKEARRNGIGGSDVSAILGLSPFRDINDLYKDKTSNKQEDKSSPAMEYGTKCEEYIRNIFKLDHKEYDVFYKKNTMFRSKDNDFICYSPDGILYDKKHKKYGILEIKTTTINQKSNYDNWNDKIPDYYFAQILQGMLVTGAEFVVLVAHLNIRDYLQKNNEVKVVREYRFERSECEDSIKYLKEKEIDFWKNNIEKRVEPPKTFKF